MVGLRLFQRTLASQNNLWILYPRSDLISNSSQNNCVGQNPQCFLYSWSILKRRLSTFLEGKEHGNLSKFECFWSPLLSWIPFEASWLETLGKISFKQEILVVLILNLSWYTTKNTVFRNDSTLRQWGLLHIASQKTHIIDDDCFYYFKSSLVPLIEGLCGSDSSFHFYVYIFCFAFSRGNVCKRKNMNLVLTTHLDQWWGRVLDIQKRKKEKKQLVQDLIPLLSIYINMYTLYSYTHIWMPRFCLSGFFGPSRCLVPNFGLITSSTLCAVGVCVCVYTHIHAHTLPPASKD